MDTKEQKYEFTVYGAVETDPPIRHQLTLRQHSNKLTIMDEAGWNIGYFGTDGKLHLCRGIPSSYPRDSLGRIQVICD